MAELHVVALQSHGHWSASFADSPEMGFGGKTAREAAQRLLHAKGRRGSRRATPGGDERRR